MRPVCRPQVSSLNCHAESLSFWLSSAQPGCHSHWPVMPWGLMCCHNNSPNSHPSCEAYRLCWVFFLKVVFLLPLSTSDSLYLFIYCKWICVWDLFDRWEQLYSEEVSCNSLYNVVYFYVQTSALCVVISLCTKLSTGLIFRYVNGVTSCLLQNGKPVWRKYCAANWYRQQMFDAVPWYFSRTILFSQSGVVSVFSHTHLGQCGSQE